MNDIYNCRTEDWTNEPWRDELSRLNAFSFSISSSLGFQAWWNVPFTPKPTRSERQETLSSIQKTKTWATETFSPPGTWDSGCAEKWHSAFHLYLWPEESFHLSFPIPTFCLFPYTAPTSYSNSFFLAINIAPSQMAEKTLKRHIFKYSPSISSFHFSWWPLLSKKLCSTKWDLTPQVISSPRSKPNKSKPLSSSFLLRDFYTAMETKHGDSQWISSHSTLGPLRTLQAVRKQRSSCSVTETIRMRKYIRKPIKPSMELELCAEGSIWELKNENWTDWVMAWLEGNPRAHKSRKHFSILNWWILKENQMWKEERDRTKELSEKESLKKKYGGNTRSVNFYCEKSRLISWRWRLLWSYTEKNQNLNLVPNWGERRQTELKKGNDICIEKNEEREKKSVHLLRIHRQAAQNC